MTKQQALYSFFAAFGLPAFADTAVPDGTPLPYLEYEVLTDSFTGEAVYPTARIWYRDDGEAAINAKVNEISRAIGDRGLLIRCDEGYVWINRASPFSRGISGADSRVKGQVLNLMTRFLTD